MRKCADVYVDNLRYACRLAESYDIMILIEPINQHDVPGYFLADTTQASDVITEIAAPNLKLLFDCYHVGSTEGDIENRFRELQPLIGHVQFALSLIVDHRMTDRLISPHFLQCLIISAGSSHLVQNIDRLARQMPRLVG